MSRIGPAVLLFLGLVMFSSTVVEACSYTPLEWQTLVQRHAIPAMVGKPKHINWVRDSDRNFVDDEIQSRFHTGELVDIIVDLNTCLTPSQTRERFSSYGKLHYIGKIITFVLLDSVRFENLSKLAQLPEVAMIEWQIPLYLFDEVSTRAVQSRSSTTYSPKTAQDAGFDGSGVTVAILDSGVDVGHKSLTGKLVAGYNAFTNTVGTPPDDVGHGTLVAGIALGAGIPGLPNNTCRSADDGSPSIQCAGVAPGAGLVSIKVCDAVSFCTNAAVMAGLDWLVSNAKSFNIRVANMSIGGCTDDDGLTLNVPNGGAHGGMAQWLVCLCA
jgi:Subtilase family